MTPWNLNCNNIIILFWFALKFNWLLDLSILLHFWYFTFTDILNGPHDFYVIWNRKPYLSLYVKFIEIQLHLLNIL